MTPAAKMRVDVPGECQPTDLKNWAPISVDASRLDKPEGCIKPLLRYIGIFLIVTLSSIAAGIASDPQTALGWSDTDTLIRCFSVLIIVGLAASVIWRATAPKRH